MLKQSEQCFILTRKTLLENPWIKQYIKFGSLPKDLDFGNSDDCKGKDFTDIFMKDLARSAFVFINKNGVIIKRDKILEEVKQKHTDSPHAWNCEKILETISKAAGIGLGIMKEIAKKYQQSLITDTFKPMITEVCTRGFDKIPKLPKFNSEEAKYYFEAGNIKLKSTSFLIHPDTDESERSYIETVCVYNQKTKSFIIEIIKTNYPYFLELLGIEYVEKKEESKGNRHEEKERDVRKRLPIVSCRGQQESGSDEYVPGTFWSMRI